MEGFKQFKKVQCFKEGGTVQRKIENFEKRERKVEEKDDMAQDKKVVKKAFSIHDKQQHEEKTDLSKLKAGGRAKKAVGTVKKFEKASGEYGAKKTTGDKKNIKEAKQFKPVKLCGGKSVKKMADGGSVFDTIKSGATKLKENLLGTPEQNRVAQEQMDKQAREGSKLAKFLGGKAEAPSAPENQSQGPFNKKRGGKVC